MELAKIKKEEIKGFDIQRLRELEGEIRRELAMLRMDLYSEQRQHAGKAKSLKKNLARVLTHRKVLSRNQAK